MPGRRSAADFWTVGLRRGAGALAGVLLAAGSAMAHVDAEWRDFGDWAVHWDKRANRIALFNSLPATRTGRMACAAAAVVGDPAELRIAGADIEGARGIMAAPGFACISFNCRRDDRRLMTVAVNAPRASGATETDPGRFSLHIRLGAAGAERAIFTNVPVRGPAESPGGGFALDAFSFTVSGDSKPIGLLLSMWTTAAFVSSLAGHERLVLRIPAGRDNRGHPQADVPHGGRTADFGLAETAAALAYFQRICNPTN